MLKHLIDKLRGSSITRRQESRVQRIGRHAISRYWTDDRNVQAELPTIMINETAAHMIEEITKIERSPNPRMANRERLCGTVSNYAKFLVLVIEPSPAADSTGLRGSPGITGELKAHLFELSQKDETLRELLRGLSDFTEQFDFVSLRFRRLHAWAHLFHTLRVAYGDFISPPDKEWFQPFVAATCAWNEHSYRQTLGLPLVLGNELFSAGEHALIMSGFFDCVMSGARNPDLDWRERIAKISVETSDPLERLASIGVIFNMGERCAARTEQ